MNKNKEIKVCDQCGKEITGDDVRYFDGQILCTDCFDNLTTLCLLPLRQSHMELCQRGF